MQLENFNYDFIKTLNINIRASKYRFEQNVETQEIVQKFDYQFKQAILDQSDFEDLLENIGAVANEVTMFDNPDNVNDYLTKAQINYSRKSIERSLYSLVKSYRNDDFKKDFLSLLSSDNDTQYYRFFFKDEPDNDGYINEIAIVFDGDLFADAPFYPVRPGAVVNHYMLLNY